MKILVCSLIVVLNIIGCQRSAPYHGRGDLQGNWKCDGVEIISTSNGSASFPMRQYGYSTLIMYGDSTYSFFMEVMKDVVLEKEVMGNPYAAVVMKAGYKHFKRGRYIASDSLIKFSDANSMVLNTYPYHFIEQTLYTKYRDRDEREWIISWKK